MRRSIWEKIEEILRKHILHGKWVRSIIALSCVVIFITTYVLIMPAVTLSGTPDCGQEEHRHTDDCYETQSEQICGLEEHTHSDDCYDEDGNLICGMEEHVHNDGCYETEEVLTCGMEEHIHTSDCYTGADTEEADVEEGSSSAEDAGESESKTEQSEDATDEVNSEDAESVDAPEAAEAADPEGSAESEEPASGNLLAEGEDYTITVSYTEEANLPADVSLKVEEITNKEEYEGYKSQVEEEILDPESKKVTAARFFDITLLDSEGNELHPEKSVTVVIETKDTLKENEELQVCHFDQEQEKPVIVKSQEIINETYEEDNLGVQFEAETFYVYGIVRTKPIGTTVLTADGETYTVTVSYTEEANLPADVSLKVEEITNKEEYEGYKSQVEEEILDPESKKVTAARFFDITLMDIEGNELHPEKAVTVVIETKDTWKENEEVQVCHFDQEKDKPVIVESQEITNKTYKEDNLGVQFEAESFSVYGIVGTELSTQFLSSNGNTYEVKVTFGKEADIPKGAELRVTEYARDSKEYAEAKESLIEYKKQTCENFNADGIGAELLDISIVDKDGKEIEPKDPVDVSIRMKSLPEDASAAVLSATAEVLHFVENSGKTEIVKVADTANTTDGMITVSETEATAKFKVESFSHFTITWGDSESATVYFVDKNGEEITTNATLGTIAAPNSGSKTVDLSKYAVNGYTFENVQIVNAGETYPGGLTIGNKLTSALDENEKTIWQYTYEVANVGEDPVTYTANVENGQKIYAIYGYGNSLTTVETVDSRSMGFHMYMTNYTSAAGIGSGSYGDGTTKLGCYSRTTAADGYPTTTTGNKSLKQWFKTDNEVTNLFLESEYDETGYFYYNSAENFAELLGSSFTVYNQLGTPSSATNFFYRRGNFMPYNRLKVSEIRNRNLYSDSGAALPESDPRYNEAIYGFKEEANDFYFGMYATADFYQPVDGKVNGEDMIYEFTGDDDMVVYIDGTLVLDLGGIHDAQKGYINFNTGEVGYTQTPTSSYLTPVWKYTSIYDQFATAGTLDKTKWDGNTFADGTEHTFQMFYMERGAGASNLKIKVNIPPIPDGSVTVTKNLEGLDATQAATEEFTIQLLTKAEGESEFTAVNQVEYTLSDVLGKTYRTDAEGKFKLKPGQSAFFAGIPAGTEIQVVEPETGRIYEVSYTATNSSGEIIEGNETTIPSAGHVAVVVKNDAEKNSKAITINKAFVINGEEASAAPVSDEFQNAEYILQESEDGQTWTDLHMVKYSNFTNQSYIFSNLDPRKVYRVIEDIADDTDGGKDTMPYTSTAYEVGTILEGGTKSGSGTTSSTIVLEKDSAFIDNEVTFTNTYQNSVAFKKLDEGTNALGGAEFTLYKEDGTTVYSYKDGEGTKSASGLTSDGSTGIFTPEKTDGIAFTLPAGTYYLVETDAPDGYNILTSRIKITVAADGTVSAKLENSSVTKDLAAFDSETKTYVISVNNSKGVMLPNTGGPGTLPYTLSGLMLIIFSALMYGFRMRRRERRLN